MPTVSFIFLFIVNTTTTTTTIHYKPGVGTKVLTREGEALHHA